MLRRLDLFALLGPQLCQRLFNGFWFPHLLPHETRLQPQEGAFRTRRPRRQLRQGDVLPERAAPGAVADVHHEDHPVRITWAEQKLSHLAGIEGLRHAGPVIARHSEIPLQCSGMPLLDGWALAPLQTELSHSRSAVERTLPR